MPFKEVDPNYKIEITFMSYVPNEFSYEPESDFVPHVKTCANFIIFPPTAYNCDANLFRKRLETAIRHSEGMMDTT